MTPPIDLWTEIKVCAAWTLCALVLLFGMGVMLG